ncbi:hypothetical protein Glove_85g10 [Diversispora epigaea]|uniref:MD-2-related lipid-recognition domain-containing protein n=1 Tax=Diversispora epigaea TaxID=1348612 RepID=A0A397J7W5_9GLOM|nr:hypothetical protein Glove_85g10 [Diversispora epigaea]
MLLMVNAIPYQLYKRTINFGTCPGDPPLSPLTVELSSDTIKPCPISAGTEFSIVENIPVPAVLPFFKILVAITATEGIKFLGCVVTDTLS